MKFKTIKQTKIYNFILDVIVCILGAAAYAYSLTTFTIPNHIAPGGANGIATIINYLTKFPVGITITLLNLPLLVIAFKVYGIKFTFKTLLCVPLVSIFVDVAPKFKPYVANPLMAAIFGGMLAGIGAAMLFSRAATAGGSDLLAKLLRRKWAHISMGSIMLSIDAIVVISSGFVFKNVESVLYAIICIFTQSATVNYLLYGRGYGKVFLIFTNNYDVISKSIIKEVGRGVSILNSVGAYTGEEKKVLICAVRKSEITKVSKLIQKYDEKAFVITTEASEIFGQGFKIYGSDKNN
ncbi:MAG: YitT family protein [Clostridia bacterium]|nr:YitT family protein [Clostridia bacterium]